MADHGHTLIVANFGYGNAGSFRVELIAPQLASSY
jgi:hypothetical protein